MKKFIFDLDGLLVNTERMAIEQWKRAAEKYGFEYNDDWVIGMMGRNSADAIKIYTEKFGSEEKAIEIRTYRVNLMLEALQKKGTEPMPGAIELLQYLKEKGYEMALATGSSQKRVGYTFQSVDIKKYFDVIITGDMVTHGKPNPELFLVAAEGLNTSPENTVILEDSAQGIEAAYSIGATSILVPDLYTPTEEILKKCSYRFNSLFEVMDNLNDILK